MSAVNHVGVSTNANEIVAAVLGNREAGTDDRDALRDWLNVLIDAVETKGYVLYDGGRERFGCFGAVADYDHVCEGCDRIIADDDEEGVSRGMCDACAEEWGFDKACEDCADAEVVLDDDDAKTMASMIGMDVEDCR